MKYGGDLWDSPAHVQGWYAIPAPEMKGRWIFGPSRIVGYDRKELTAYIAGNRPKGRVNGGTTQKHLKQWRIEVEASHPNYLALKSQLIEFLAFRDPPARPAPMGKSAHIYVVGALPVSVAVVPNTTELEKNLRAEGALLSKTVNFRGRSASVRVHCVEHYKAVCTVCKQNFGSTFGEDFVGLIDVHHLDPLAQADESRQTDPVKHCRPLCPNCHRLAHYGMPKGTCRPLAS